MACGIFSLTLLVYEMSAIVQSFEHSLALLFFGIGWKLTFSSPVTTADFSKFAGILIAAFSQHHHRFWNSSTGISSPPLALCVVMIPKAHLTSHSRSRRESSEINSHIYDQLIYDKGGKSRQWSKDSFFNKWCWEYYTATCKIK